MFLMNLISKVYRNLCVHLNKMKITQNNAMISIGKISTTILQPISSLTVISKHLKNFKSNKHILSCKSDDLNGIFGNTYIEIVLTLQIISRILRLEKCDINSCLQIDAFRSRLKSILESVQFIVSNIALIVSVANNGNVYFHYYTLKK